MFVIYEMIAPLQALYSVVELYPFIISSESCQFYLLCVMIICCLQPVSSIDFFNVFYCFDIYHLEVDALM